MHSLSHHKCCPGCSAQGQVSASLLCWWSRTWRWDTELPVVLPHAGSPHSCRVSIPASGLAGKVCLENVQTLGHFFFFWLVFVVVVFSSCFSPTFYFYLFIYFVLHNANGQIVSRRGGWARAAGGRESCQPLEGSRAPRPAGRAFLRPPPGGARCALVLSVRGSACLCLSSSFRAALRGGGAPLAVAERARLNSSLSPQAKRMSDGKCIVWVIHVAMHHRWERLLLNYVPKPVFSVGAVLQLASILGIPSSRVFIATQLTPS